MPTPPELPALGRQIRRDMILDTLGNTVLALGLWGWLKAGESSGGLLHEPVVFIALTATGVLNLLHLPARFRRLREWRRRQS
jgi:hypothetical protein